MVSGPARPPARWSQATEIEVAAEIPRLELANWRERHGLVAGITARGGGEGRGFDLGLWTDAPVGEVMSRWRAFRRSLPGCVGFVLGTQVHGAEVMTIGPASGWVQVEGIDGWVTTTPGTYLGVTIADCIPVYLAMPGRGVALLHAGWRGIAAGILGAGLEQLLLASGGVAADVVMHCGVGICGNCYEVGSEVMSGCGIPQTGSGPWHLDLRDQLSAQAAAAGVGRITISSWCSAHDRSRFYSHRASGGSDGRMVAYLGIPRA
jgi:hypothetical protein